MFLKGFSHLVYESLYPWEDLTKEERIEWVIRELRSLNANCWRIHIHWKDIEPLISEPFLKIEDINDKLVNDYAFDNSNINWKDYDLIINKLKKSCIEPFIVIGAGYTPNLPIISNNRMFIPDNIGKKNYLAHLYLHARAVVRRYKKSVRYWQIENELNWTFMHTILVIWRTGKAWLDKGFLDSLVRTLYKAIKEEDAEAIVTHNFMCGSLLKFDSYLLYIKRWHKYIDTIGLDVYPNYVIGYPIMGYRVGERVREVKALALKKPIFVTETGYPSKPLWRGFSEERQALYIHQAISSAVRENANGFFYYSLISPEGKCGLWQNNNPFCEVEHWWGLIRKDNSYKKAYHTFKEIISR